MSLSNETPIRTYCGNGTTVAWSLPFSVKQETHVGVYLTSPEGKETRLTENFSVDLAERTVTYPAPQSELAPLSAGWKITLRRHTPLTQQVDLTQQGELDVEALEGGLDKTVMQIQELAEQLSRAVTFRPAQDGAQTDAQAYLEELRSAQAQAVSQVTQLTGEALAGAQEAVEAARAANGQAVQSVQTAQEAAQQAQQASRQAASVQAGLAEYVAQAVAAKESAAEAQTAAAQCASACENASALARKWAVQTSAEVAAGEGYGAKKYAQDAAQSAQQVQTAQTECAAHASSALASKNAAAGYAENAGENAARAVSSASAAQSGAAAALASAQDAALSAAVSRGLAVGTVYYSQSALNTDNPGALPLFTGETVISANTIYPDFWAWVTRHTDLQCTAEEYESALETYGECPYYVLDADAGSMRLPKLVHYVKMADTAAGVTQSGPGLPNITGRVFQNEAGYNVASGAFYKGKQSPARTTNTGSAGVYVEFDASQSSSVYGSSETVTPAHSTLYPWVTAFTHAVEASVAQAAAFQTALVAKADIGLGNVPAHIDYVVESFQEGTGWYRRWRSGRLEQGGKKAVYANQNTAVTLLKPYADTNYQVFAVYDGGTGAGAAGGTTAAVNLKSETGFSIGSQGGDASWYAIGREAEE